MSPWERRERGGLYYTRSRKVNGQLVREYVGGGLLGQLAARMDAEERRKRQQEAAAWKEGREQIEALTAPVEELCEGVEILARAALLTPATTGTTGESGGKGVNKEIAKVSHPIGCPPSPNLAAISEEEVEDRREIITRLHELTKKAQKGNKKVIPEIREILDRNPDLAWHLANLGKTAERLLIDKLTKEKDLAGEIMEHQLESMRQEVAGENASPLERLLAERVVVTWLQVQLFEALYFANLGNLTINQANYHQKRLDRVHRHHLSAIRTLAQIRKLGPAVQINIAEKQINTTGSDVYPPETG